MKRCGEPAWDRRLRREVLAREAPALGRFYPRSELNSPTSSFIERLAGLFRRNADQAPGEPLPAAATRTREAVTAEV